MFYSKHTLFGRFGVVIMLIRLDEKAVIQIKQNKHQEMKIIRAQRVFGVVFGILFHITPTMIKAMDGALL